MIFFKILAYTNFESNAKQVILGAFLSESGKNGIIEVIFLQNWACTIFFVTKFQFLEKKLVRPLVANGENKIFCWRSTQKCSQVSKTLSCFPGIFLNSLWPFQTSGVVWYWAWYHYGICHAHRTDLDFLWFYFVTPF